MKMSISFEINATNPRFLQLVSKVEELAKCLEANGIEPYVTLQESQLRGQQEGKDEKSTRDETLSKLWP